MEEVLIVCVGNSPVDVDANLVDDVDNNALQSGEEFLFGKL